jgi:hypothetical protein
VVAPTDPEVVKGPAAVPQLKLPAFELDEADPPPKEPALLDDDAPEAEPAIDMPGAAWPAPEQARAMVTADAKSKARMKLTSSFAGFVFFDQSRARAVTLTPRS